MSAAGQLQSLCELFVFRELFCEREVEWAFNGCSDAFANSSAKYKRPKSAFPFYGIFKDFTGFQSHHDDDDADDTYQLVHM